MTYLYQRYIDLSAVTHLEAESNYTTIHLVCGKKETFSYTLKRFQDILNPSFVRIHQSFIVNKEYIKCIKPTKVILLSDLELPLARRRKGKVVTTLNNSAGV